MPRIVVVSLVSLLAASCGAPLPDLDPVAPDEQGRGEQDGPCVEDVYPCGPYGVQPGAIMKNLALPGLRARVGAGTVADEKVDQLKLSEYFADKGIKVLVITSSAEWCQPCMAEQPGLKKLYDDYRNTANKVAIFEAVIEDSQGAPATIEVARRWAKKYGLHFDVAIDPTGLLKPYYDINAFPMNMVIRASDMKITWQENGLDPGALRTAVEQAINNP